MTIDLHIAAKIPSDLHQDLKQVLTNPIRFFKLLQIPDKQTQRLQPFRLNIEQLQLLGELEQHQRLIVLKPRQIGISTLLRAYAFWKAYTTTARESWAVISFHDRSAKHLRRMDTLYHTNLPELLQRELERDSSTDMQFADTGATLSSYTAGSRGGTRSFSLSSVHLSEFAWYENPGNVLAAVTAALPRDGKIIIESTPKAAGDVFHQLCSDAPGNGWQLVCFWWWMHHAYRLPVPDDWQTTLEEQQLIARYGVDEGQLAWRRQQVATLGLSDFKREYPGSLEDAFHAGSSTYFDGEALDKIEPVRMRAEELRLQPPADGEVYVSGIDVAAGVGRDYSVITIASALDSQIVYTFRSNKLSPARFSEKVMQEVARYNDAYTLIESNNHGHLVIDRLQGYDYRNLWADGQGRSWTTTLQSKVSIYENLREYIHNHMLQQLPDSTLLELRSLTVEKVAPEAPKGLHDDLAISLALCYRALRDIPPIQLRGHMLHKMESFIEHRRTRRTRTRTPWKVAT
jgi:hypothetical protein